MEKNLRAKSLLICQIKTILKDKVVIDPYLGAVFCRKI